MVILVTQGQKMTKQSAFWALLDAKEKESSGGVASAVSSAVWHRPQAELTMGPWPQTGEN